MNERIFGSWIRNRKGKKIYLTSYLNKAIQVANSNIDKSVLKKKYAIVKETLQVCLKSKKNRF